MVNSYGELFNSGENFMVRIFLCPLTRVPVVNLLVERFSLQPFFGSGVCHCCFKSFEIDGSK
jgi:hypothetical protein